MDFITTAERADEKQSLSVCRGMNLRDWKRTAATASLTTACGRKSSAVSEGHDIRTYFTAKSVSPAAAIEKALDFLRTTDFSMLKPGVVEIEAQPLCPRSST